MKYKQEGMNITTASHPIPNDRQNVNEHKAFNFFARSVFFFRLSYLALQYEGNVCLCMVCNMRLPRLENVLRPNWTRYFINFILCKVCYWVHVCVWCVWRTLRAIIEHERRDADEGAICSAPGCPNECIIRTAVKYWNGRRFYDHEYERKNI